MRVFDGELLKSRWLERDIRDVEHTDCGAALPPPTLSGKESLHAAVVTNLLESVHFGPCGCRLSAVIWRTDHRFSMRLLGTKVMMSAKSNFIQRFIVAPHVQHLSGAVKSISSDSREAKDFVCPPSCTYLNASPAKL